MNFDLIKDVNVNVKIIIAEKEMKLADVLKLNEDSIIDFPTYANNKAVLYVNDIAIAEGDVIVTDENKFGLRISEIYDKSNKNYEKYEENENDFIFDDETIAKNLSHTIEGLTGKTFKFEKYNISEEIKGLKYIIGNYELYFPCEFVYRMVDFMLGGEGDENSECNQEDIDGFNEIIRLIIADINDEWRSFDKVNQESKVVFKLPEEGTFKSEAIYKYDNGKLAFGIKELKN